MELSIEALIEIPSLGCTLLAGDRGGSRLVSWAHVCELREPWRWIGRDALCMTTGLGVPEFATEQVAYVTEMYNHGIAGVAIGQNMSAPEITAEMLARADELGFPLIEVRQEIPFITLATTVAAANASAAQERLTKTERIYELTREHLTPSDDSDLLDELARILDADLALVRGDRPISLRPGIPVAKDEQDAIIERLARPRGTGQAVIRFDSERYLVPIVAATQTALVVKPRDAQGIDVTLAQHAATVITARLSVEAAEFSREGQLSSALLARLLDGQIESNVAHEMLSVRGVQGPQRLYTWLQHTPLDTGHAVRQALALREIPHLLSVRDGYVVLLTASGDDVEEAILRALPATVQVGVSTPSKSAGDAPLGFRQAKWCLERAEDLQRRLVRYDDDDATSVFLPHEEEALQYVVERVLGKLIEYDRQRNSQLLLSLRVFLEENRSWMRASARLFVHKQTLVYRIDRVEEITGRKLNSMADSAELWLALSAANSLGIHGADEPQPTREGARS